MGLPATPFAARRGPALAAPLAPQRLRRHLLPAPYRLPMAHSYPPISRRGKRSTTTSAASVSTACGPASSPPFAGRNGCAWAGIPSHRRRSSTRRASRRSRSPPDQRLRRPQAGQGQETASAWWTRSACRSRSPSHRRACTTRSARGACSPGSSRSSRDWRRSGRTGRTRAGSWRAGARNTAAGIWRSSGATRRRRASRSSRAGGWWSGSFAWLVRNRRLRIDYERKLQTSETLIEVAFIRLLLRRLARANEEFKQALRALLPVRMLFVTIAKPT